MPRFPFRPVVLASALLLPAAPAFCQSPGLAGQDRVGAGPFGGTQSPPSQPAHTSRAALAPLATAGQPWPRLDVGAVLCRTQEDLQQRAAQFADPTAAGPAHCRLVARATPVTIVQRAGAGATEVRVTASDGETGWTDAFLPDKAPH